MGDPVKGVLLLSGGIDSPVAGYVMGRQGVDLIAVHLDPSAPGEPSETDKVVEIMDRLDTALGTTVERIVVAHGGTLDAFSSRCKPNLTCVLCRRFMLRVASRLGEDRGASFIITGESLGQVASQTLRNILVEEGAASLPVLRPLIGMDKVEIERVAKEVGTYDISISSGSCCRHAPDKPSTAAAIETVLEEEAKVGIDGMVAACMESSRQIARGR